MTLEQLIRDYLRRRGFLIREDAKLAIAHEGSIDLGDDATRVSVTITAKITRPITDVEGLTERVESLDWWPS